MIPERREKDGRKLFQDMDWICTLEILRITLGVPNEEVTNRVKFQSTIAASSRTFFFKDSRDRKIQLV